MSRDLTGKTVGGFRLSDILARGVGSTVYAAEQTSTGEKVAIKVLLSELPKDKAAAAKLLAEVRRATAIPHRNLVPVLDVDSVEHKGKRHLYVAMELLHGESLKSRLAATAGLPPHALPLHVALQVASEVGGALQTLHQADVVHGGINPGSVFLVPPSDAKKQQDPDAEEQVYLLDTGLLAASETGAKSSKPRTIDDVSALAQLVSDMLGGLPETATNGKNAVLPLHWHNRKVPARVDAALRAVLGHSKGAEKGSQIDSVGTLVSALLGTVDTLPSLHSWSEEGRRGMPAPRRNSNLLLAASLALLGGAGVGYLMHSPDPGPTAIVQDLAPVRVDLAAPAPADLSAPHDGSAVSAPSGATPSGAEAAAPPVWKKRTGPKIPPLRDAEGIGPPAPLAAPVAPAAAAAKPDTAATPAATATKPAAIATPPAAATPVKPAAAVTPAVKPTPATAAAPGATAVKPTVSGPTTPAPAAKAPATPQSPSVEKTTAPAAKTPQSTTTVSPQPARAAENQEVK